jgi:hypothetical protein
VLQPIGDGLQEIVSGKHFISEGELIASFHLPDDAIDMPLICNISSSLVVVGDLQFYFQVLGCKNMSGSWYCWCTEHPSAWHSLCHH